MADARGTKRFAARDPKRLRTGQILHLADHRRLHGLSAAEDVHRLVGEVLGAFRLGHDQGAAAVGDEAAFEQVERVGDHPRVHHVFHGDRIAERGPWVHARPLALHDGDHGQLLVRHPVLLHVAQHADGEHGGWTHAAVGPFELGRQRCAPAAPAAPADAGASALAVGDQDGVRVAGLDGGRRVTDVQHERTAADGTAVHPPRRDAEIVGDGDWRFAGGCDPVDVLGLQPRVCERVEGGIGMELNLA